MLIASHSYAGVKEKKAIRAMTAEVEAGMAQMKTNCGNNALALQVDVDKKFSVHNISIATSNAKDFFKGMLEVCKDADYKEEIQNVDKIVVTLSDNNEQTGTNEKIYGEIKLNETALHVAFHISYSMSNGLADRIPKAIKDLY